MSVPENSSADRNMAVIASNDMLPEASAAVDVSNTDQATQPSTQPISASAARHQTISVGVSVPRPFSSNPSTRSPKGFMLFNACSRGQVHLVREYISGGIDVNWQDDLGYFALLVASKKGHCQVVATLLAAGANPNLSCAWGDSPLFVTAVAGHRCCMHMLLVKGADLYHRNRKDKTVADAVVDELRRKPSESLRLKLASCLELIVTTHARALHEAEAHANIVDIEGAAAVVINPGFELHVVGSELIPTSSRSELST